MESIIARVRRVSICKNVCCFGSRELFTPARRMPDIWLSSACVLFNRCEYTFAFHPLLALLIFCTCAMCFSIETTSCSCRKDSFERIESSSSSGVFRAEHRSGARSIGDAAVALNTDEAPELAHALIGIPSHLGLLAIGLVVLNVAVGLN